MAKIYGELEKAQLENSATDLASTANGLVYFNTTSKTPKYYDGTRWVEIGEGGAGAGGINYITNYAAETNITGWSLFDDGSVESPVDGTGGTASNITWTRSTSSPIYGTASFLLTKSAADARGEGVSYDFNTVGLKFISNRVRFFVETDSNYVDESLSVWLYAKDSSGLIQPTGEYKIKKRTGVKRIALEYVGLSTDDDYRLIIHCNSTTATAYTVKFDIVEVGPSDLLFETEKAKQYDLTVTGTDWTTIRAVGMPYKVYDESENEKWRLRFNIVGSVTSATRTGFNITLANVIFKNTSSYYQAVASSFNASGNQIFAAANPGLSTINCYHNSTATTRYDWSGDVELNSKPTFVVDDFEVVRSSDEGVVAFTSSSTVAVTGTPSSTASIIKFAVESNYSGAYDPSTGYFTCPEDGEYHTSTVADFIGSGATVGQYGAVFIYKNGALYCPMYNTLDNVSNQQIRVSLSKTLHCLRGDTISIWGRSSMTGVVYNTPSYTQCSIHKVHGSNSLIVGEAALGYLPNYQYLNGASIPSTTNAYGWHNSGGSDFDGTAWIGGINLTEIGALTARTNHLGQSVYADFDGTSDAIYLNSASFDTTNESFTAYTWFKPDNASRSEYLMSKYVGTAANDSWRVYKDTSYLYFAVAYNATTSITISAPADLFSDTTKNYFLAAVYSQSSNTMTLYCDGKIIAHTYDTNLATRNNNANSKVTFGAYGNGTIGGGAFDGGIYECGYFKYAATFDEIRKMYVTGTKKKGYVDENDKVLINGETYLGDYTIIVPDQTGLTNTSYADITGFELYTPISGHYKFYLNCAQFDILGSGVSGQLYLYNSTDAKILSGLAYDIQSTSTGPTYLNAGGVSYTSKTTFIPANKKIVVRGRTNSGTYQLQYNAFGYDIVDY